MLPLANASIQIGEDLLSCYDSLADEYLHARIEKSVPNTKDMRTGTLEGDPIMEKYQRSLKCFTRCQTKAQAKLDVLVSDLKQATLATRTDLASVKVKDPECESDMENISEKRLVEELIARQHGDLPSTLQELTGIYLFLFTSVQLVRCWVQLPELFGVVLDQRLHVHRKTFKERHKGVTERVKDYFNVPKEQIAASVKFTVALLTASLISAYEYNFNPGKHVFLDIFLNTYLFACWGPILGLVHIYSCWISRRCLSCCTCDGRRHRERR